MLLEDVGFVNSRGQRLAATLHRPEGSWPTWGAVVAHGMLSSKESPKHVALANLVAKLGGAALRFDFAGRGCSEGDPTDLTVSGELDDLQAALTWLRGQRVDWVSLIGSSLGGTVALLHTATDPDIATLITVAAPAVLPSTPEAVRGEAVRRLPGGLVETESGERIRETFFTDTCNHDPLAAASRVACPWLVVHGMVDTVVPAEDASRLAGAAPDARVVLVSQADHASFSDRDLAQLEAEVRAFLTEQRAVVHARSR